MKKNKLGKIVGRYLAPILFSVVLVASFIPFAAPEPVQAAALDVGPGATDRASYASTSYTWICPSNPADYTGLITSVEIWAYTDMTGVKIGTFYGSGTSYTSRAFATIAGTVTAGAKRTYTAPTDFTAFAVTAGDYLGIYSAAGGQLECDGNAGGLGLYEKAGDQFGAGVQTYTAYANYGMSIYATGITPSATFRAAGVSPGANSTSCVIVKPVGLTVGDLMIAQVVAFSATDATPPDGTWHLIRRDTTSTTVIESALWWKTAVQADVDAANFTFTTPNASNGGAITAWYNSDGNPLNVVASNGQANAASTTVTAPTITPPANSMVLMICGITDNNNQSTYAIATSNPASWAEAYDQALDLTNDLGLSLGYATRFESTGTGNGTATTSGSDRNTGQLLAINVVTIVAPTVTTQAVSAVEATTATGNGTITDIGYATVTRRGFCYMTGTSGDPTTADNVTYDDSSYDTGAYTKGLTGLSTGTNYRVRAYAVNSAGTGYGVTVQILTKPAPVTGMSATENNVAYVTVAWTNSTGATTYHVWRGASDLGHQTTPYNDTGGVAPLITNGVSRATDGTYSDKIALDFSTAPTVANGTSYTYKVIAENATGSSTGDPTDTGYRLATALTYQWNRSAADSDADYSAIGGATGTTYNDTLAALAPLITEGNSVASDGTDAAHVDLSLSGTSVANGDKRYWNCTITSTGASNTPQTATANEGYRIATALTYQWNRSAADSNADYSTIGGATSSTYEDTGAPADGSGRYYTCTLVSTNASNTPGTAANNRGYRQYVAGTISPESKDFGIVELNTISSTAIDEFTLVNTGNVAVDVDIQGEDLTGGDDTWDLSDNATVGENVYGVKAGTASFNIIVKKNSPYNELVSNLAASDNQTWGLQILMPSSVTNYDMQEMSANVTLIISAH